MAKAWLIASGKGGVGKSMVTACMAVALYRIGQRTGGVVAENCRRDKD